MDVFSGFYLDLKILLKLLHIPSNTHKYKNLFFQIPFTNNIYHKPFNETKPNVMQTLKKKKHKLFSLNSYHDQENP